MWFKKKEPKMEIHLFQQCNFQKMIHRSTRPLAQSWKRNQQNGRKWSKNDPKVIQGSPTLKPPPSPLGSKIIRIPHPINPPAPPACRTRCPIDSGHARQATVKCGRERQEDDRVATGRRQVGDRKTTGQRQESGRKATGSNRQAIGRRQGKCDRRATGGRQGGDRVATGRRQESDRKQDIATG